MRLQKPKATGIVCFAVSLCLIKGYVVALADDPAPESVAEALAAVRGEFSPLGQADLDEARQELNAAVARLNARLEEDDPAAEGWREYLKWDVLQAELARQPGPNLEELDRAYARFAAGYHGLGLVWFEDVRLALRHYLGTARAVGDPNLKTQYEALLAALPEYLDRYRQEPTVDDAVAINGAMQWLVAAGQGDAFLDAVRARYQHPNLFIEMVAEVAVAGFERPIDDTMDVRDRILSADVYGTGHTVGQVTATLVSSSEHAEILTVLRGTTTSDTVGYSGPARVYSDGTTEIVTQKRILVDADGMRSAPAASEAETSSTITGVGSRRGSRLVERIACRKAQKQKCVAEQIAAQHAEEQANDRVDDEATENLTDANRGFRRRFRRPLEDRKLFPQVLRFSTTEDALRVRGLRARPVELAAPGAPPELTGESDLKVRVHESLVNNMAAEALAGMIVQEEELRADSEEVFGSVPKQLEPEPGEEPWGITFAAQKPVWAAFDRGEFRVGIRGIAFSRSGSNYPGMDVTAVYRIQQTDQGLAAVRQGELAIYPPGFVPGSRQLSAREQVIRRLLQRRLDRVFEPTIVPDDLTLPDPWSKVGPLELVHWDTQDGWMLLGWQRKSPQ